MAKRIEAVDTLRGLAALAVAWFHFTFANTIAPEGTLKSIGKYGWLGVEVFFVISGFIIPYALHRAGYRLKDFKIFLVKRLTRLDPPYFLSIIMVLAVGYALTLAPNYSGEPFRPGLGRTLLHLGYLNVMAGYEWLNPVYWTLAIEFQYYLLMGLIFPLISSQHRWRRLLAFAILSVLGWTIPSGAFIFPFIFLFCMGMVLFQYRVNIVGKREVFLLLALFVCANYLMLGISYTLAGLVGVAGIAFLRIRNPVLIFLGSISYSLYLVHPPVTRIVFTLGRSFAQSNVQRNLLIFCALVASILAAWVSYLLVERPAQKWSASFKYRRAVRAEEVSAPVLLGALPPACPDGPPVES